ncbi:BON domain-containing protein [Nitrospira sp. Nam74]
MTRSVPKPAIRLVLLVVSCLHLACAHANYAADEAITRAVVRALVHEEKVNLTRVDVQTTEATVYLSGEVQNYAQKRRAEDIARTVHGVRRVVNKLELQP